MLFRSALPHPPGTALRTLRAFKSRHSGTVPWMPGAMTRLVDLRGTGPSVAQSTSLRPVPLRHSIVMASCIQGTVPLCRDFGAPGSLRTLRSPSPNLGGAPPSQTLQERRSEHFAPSYGEREPMLPLPTLRFANRYRSWLAKLPTPTSI